MDFRTKLSMDCPNQKSFSVFFRKHNNRSYFVFSAEDVQSDWFSGVEPVGICGAISTPQWLMEKVDNKIKQL